MTFLVYVLSCPSKIPRPSSLEPSHSYIIPSDVLIELACDWKTVGLSSDSSITFRAVFPKSFILRAGARSYFDLAHTSDNGDSGLDSVCE